jgi:hypothetical protein
VTASRLVLPDLDLLDAAGLKALILSQHDQLLSHQSEIEHLKREQLFVSCDQFFLLDPKKDA